MYDGVIEDVVIQDVVPEDVVDEGAILVATMILGYRSFERALDGFGLLPTDFLQEVQGEHGAC